MPNWKEFINNYPEEEARGQVEAKEKAVAEARLAAEKVAKETGILREKQLKKTAEIMEKFQVETCLAAIRDQVWKSGTLYRSRWGYTLIDAPTLKFHSGNPVYDKDRMSRSDPEPPKLLFYKPDWASEFRYCLDIEYGNDLKGDGSGCLRIRDHEVPSDWISAKKYDPEDPFTIKRYMEDKSYGQHMDIRWIKDGCQDCTNPHDSYRDEVGHKLSPCGNIALNPQLAEENLRRFVVSTMKASTPRQKSLNELNAHSSFWNAEQRNILLIAAGLPLEPPKPLRQSAPPSKQPWYKKIW